MSTRPRAAANPPDTSTSSLLVTHEAIAPTSSLADQQNKSSGNDQQSKQNTDDERNNRMPIGPDLFRPSAFLRCSDTQPEEKFVHLIPPAPRRIEALRSVARHCAGAQLLMRPPPESGRTRTSLCERWV